MGKKGKPSAGKAAAKAAKKEKAEKQATKKLTKQAAKQKSQTNGGGGKSANKQQNGKKGAAAPDDDEEDLDALLARYREQWEQEHTVSEERSVVHHLVVPMQPSHTMPTRKRSIPLRRRVLQR